jgi:hypothetical protein
MFDTKRTFSHKAADAADLIIDFATLGEYGLEPVDTHARPCESRHRIGSPRRSTGTWNAAIQHFALWGHDKN